MNLDDKLFKIKYESDNVSHLKADNSVCKTCQNRICENICPAHVWEWDDVKKQICINYENCLECGACRVACPHNAITWSYPKGTKGVTFRHG